MKMRIKIVTITLAILAFLLYPQPLEFQLPPPEPPDLASECLRFPCYTAKMKLWVSQKYLTKRR